MSDALTNAERLLRKNCELRYEATGWCPAGDAACSQCAAADALAAERERRGPTRQQVVDVLERYRRMAWDGAEKNAIIAVGQSVLALFTAAPPLPPATGRDDGGMTEAYIVVNKRDGRVMGDCSTLAEAEALRRDCIAADEASEYAVASFVPPATGEGRDAVIEECAKVCERVAADYEAGPTKTRPRTADVCANAIRALKSARPTPEPSEAMVEAAYDELQKWRNGTPRAVTAKTEKAEVRSVTYAMLRAALAAQEGTP